MSSILSEKNLYDFGTAIKERYDFIVENYENLKNYAIYATIDSTVALSIKNVLSYEGGYESVNTIVNELFDYINTFSKENEDEIIPLLNDYQKLCIYLMRYNKTLYFSFLKERHKMKMAGLIK